MRNFRPLYSVVSSALAVATLVACSGGSASGPGAVGAPGLDAASRSIPESPSTSQLSPTSADARRRSNTTTSRVFVSGAGDNFVDAYDAKGHRLYQITSVDAPQGLATDALEKLYVADTADSKIQVYAKPDGGAPVTLEDAGQYPAGVAVSAKLVAATNILSTSGGAGSVTFYAQGATTPCATVSNATTFARVYSGAFDAHGDPFVDGTDNGGNATVGEVSGGCAAKAIAPLTLGDGVSLGFPGTVGVNTHDQIVLSGQNGIYTFAQPAHGSLGKPLHTTHVSGGLRPAHFTFAADETQLWSVASHVAEYLYPTGGSPIAKFEIQGQPVGIAVLPAETP